MIFRTNTGKLMEVKKYDFANDSLYYKKLMEIKTPIIKNNIDIVFSKLEKTLNDKK